MCGINGAFYIHPEPELSNQIFRMNNSLSHRGPDDEGKFIDQNRVGLGHRRLSIIDLSDSGHQPMADVSGNFRIVFNGEIYNYKEVKIELINNYNIKFKSGSDTEVLLYAFITWGEKCLDRLNGMFAFAIYDVVNANLFIARDRLGIKPFYYYKTENSLIFSSELRALLSSDKVPRKLNIEKLNEYISYQTVFAPDTIVKDVFMLMPGYYMNICDKGSRINIELKRYWNIDEFSFRSNANNYEEAKAGVRELFLKSVERRLIADVPFGAFLSGGIDSSLVVGAMSEFSSKVNTFSVTFSERKFNESVYSDFIAKRFSTYHTEIKLTETDFINELPDALDAMDHPTGDGPNTFVVSHHTRKAGIKMALSGLGGDELFGGYPVFKRLPSLMQNKFLNGSPVFFRRLAGNILGSLENSDFKKLGNYLTSLSLTEKYLIFRTINFSPEKITDKPYLGTGLSDLLPDSDKLVSSISIMEIKGYMQNILLRDTDQMSMKHALEIRVPFLDYKLVEFVLGLKDEFKKTDSPKRLLVDSFPDLLPPEIVNRKKMGFTLPWDVWMRNDLSAFVSDNVQAAERSGLYAPGMVSKLHQNYLKNTGGVRWTQLWHIVVLQYWMSRNHITL